ncbi:Do family serine endopeptidase [Algicella marina]|uniref:Probable periplasmic serine endoprotease DegP-like n=1 Tax=Algicella marina TaxID=2683284 RepID=A0A6P1T4C7_9RHOB|nr:Do family serine endopeptidase [Algicella marina]QHQ36560.1 Do family serine endopeptidase [Algicella marina]
MILRTSSRAALLIAAAMAAAPIASVPAFAQVPAGFEEPSFAPLVKAAKPAVVTVMVKGASGPVAQPGGQNVPPQLREFFERFGQPFPEFEQRTPRQQQGIGSGFILESDGLIVTNNHVVEGAEEITVRLDDGRELKAELIGRDDKVDLAVIKVEAQDLPVLEWGDSDAAEVGDWAMAIGNPFGLGGTVTTGIVSARGRDIGSGPYDDYIQVDAAINKGNSGGPLLDFEGKVIGVNTAIYSPTGGSVGLGFSIPAKQARAIVDELVANGTVERGWIGVRIQPVTDEIAESLGLAGASGALVVEVTEGSPAEKAGLKSGDVITGFAASEVVELRDLTRIVAESEVGQSVKIAVWRSGEQITLDIAPALLETAALSGPGGATEPAGLGMSLRPLTGDEQTALDIEGGLIITGVSGGPAAEAGLGEGDVVLSVNQRPVNAPEDVAAAVDAAKEAKRGAVLLQVVQGGQPRFVTMSLPVS